MKARAISLLRNKTFLIFMAALIFAVASISALVYLQYRQQQAEEIDSKVTQALADPNLATFAEADLAEFDGTNPDKPIYIGLDGFVYDVTSGSRFYAIGNGYHYLAGKDSSADLAEIGGDIIKAKYPIVGRLID